MKITFTILSFLSILLMNGCTKSDMPAASADKNKVKVFDDKITDPRNCGMRIAAGNGRFCMTYGYLEDQIYNFAIPPPALRNQWMITDNDGNLIKQDSLPSGFSLGDVLALDDNSFMIIVCDNNQNSSTFNSIQLFHLDQNGQKISDFTLLLPADVIILYQIYNVHLFRSVNGNPLLSFHHGSGGTDDYAFVGELNLNGSFLWYKLYSCLDITGCVSTPDNNYIFTGINDSLTSHGCMGMQTFRVFVFKTNSSGDSLSYHTYNALNEIIECGNIISGSNGNYRFWFSCGVNSDNNHIPVFIYEVNSNGDLVNSIAISLKNRNHAETIIPKNDGGVLVLMNTSNMTGSSPYFYDNFYEDLQNNQSNTSLVSLDANLKITSTVLFQNNTTDLFKAACKSHDSKIACFGLIQGYQKDYYKPGLIILY